MQNNLISQAGQMESSGTPNDLLPAMNQVGCIVLGPLVQEILYPLLHRRGVYLTAITRITIGFVFVTLSMMYATIVQTLIYQSPPCYNRPQTCGSNKINVWIQAPLYFFMSAGEIFAYVAAVEYANENSPKGLEVVVQAVSLLIGGAGSAVAMILTLVAHDPNLIAFYSSLTGAMAITTVGFWRFFRNLGESLTIPDRVSS
jgi:POT family proton-dependent oligopeptide transporter